jgi:hypothetical protein
MKRLSFLVALFLSSFCITNGQQPEWKTIYSDEFHFIASFPGDPEKSEGNITTALGKGTASRWTLELPGIAYEIFVADFPDLAVKMDGKTLRSVYQTACAELGGSPRACRGELNDDRFGEQGHNGGFRTGSLYVQFVMFLAGNRFYQAKVVSSKSAQKENWEDIAKFVDKFLFTHLDESEKKLNWGLPKNASQNRKDN